MRTAIAESSTGLTVLEIIEAYLKEHVAHKVVAQDRQEYGGRHITDHLGQMVVSEIDIPACRKYVKDRMTEGAAPSTIKREMTILRAAAHHAVRWRRLSTNDLPQLEMPAEGESEHVKWFTKEQVTTMFRECNSGRLACFIRIAYFTAARKHSVERLLKSQVDVAGERIHLWRPGEKITKKRRPTVPLYPEIRPAVDWLMGASGTEYLFGRIGNFYRPFWKMTKKLGFEGNPHMLRHSRATHMLMEGENIYKVAKLLGDSVATVERVYGHSSLAFLATKDSGIETRMGV